MPELNDERLSILRAICSAACSTHCKDDPMGQACLPRTLRQSRQRHLHEITERGVIGYGALWNIVRHFADEKADRRRGGEHALNRDPSDPIGRRLGFTSASHRARRDMQVAPLPCAVSASGR
jgi:hypothetical protein